MFCSAAAARPSTGRCRTRGKDSSLWSLDRFWPPVLSGLLSFRRVSLRRWSLYLNILQLCPCVYVSCSRVFTPQVSYLQGLQRLHSCAAHACARAHARTPRSSGTVMDAILLGVIQLSSVRGLGATVGVFAKSSLVYFHSLGQRAAFHPPALYVIVLSLYHRCKLNTKCGTFRL